MYKRSRARCLLLGALIVISVACKHKPAYSDIDANRTARNQNQNSEAQATAAPPNAAEPPAPAASQPAPARPQSPPFKQPSFVDPFKNEARDLPNYPRAMRVRVQIGPVQGVNVMSLVLRTFDSMDKIAAFYEKAISNNKWTVVDKSVGPELSEWTLSKGEDNSAKVQVKKDPQTRAMNIVIVRGEKLEPGK